MIYNTILIVSIKHLAYYNKVWYTIIKVRLNCYISLSAEAWVLSVA